MAPAYVITVNMIIRRVLFQVYLLIPGWLVTAKPTTLMLEKEYGNKYSLRDKK